MAFRSIKLGALVFKDPAQASAQLTKMFAAHVSVKAVAEAEGVNPATLHRWLDELRERGHDPRNGIAPPKGPASKFDATRRHRQLGGLFARGLTQGEVARKLKVNRSTVIRWVAQVIEAGYPDPRLQRS